MKLKTIKTISTPLLSMAMLFMMMTVQAVSAEEKKFSDAQKAEIQELVKQYILDNPDIIPAAVQILRQREVQAAIEQNKTLLLNDGVSYVGGNINGDVTVVEFFDYNCGYCKRALSTVNKLIDEDPNVRVVFKELPILSESSMVAARAAMASIKQNKYNEFHAALMLNRQSLSEDVIFRIATEVGIDTAKLAGDMTDDAIGLALQQNRALAQQLNITGTPGFVIGNAIIPGALPLEDLQKAVADARAANKMKN